jgi:ATP-dependent Clp protease ATP-binding subunit ClpC
MAALKARKGRLEQFHEVKFADEALECAVRRADAYLKDKMLPGKALELLDAAGAAAKLRASSEPGEIADVRKKLASILERIENAIANHEFEKARYYAEEQRNENENLRTLRKKHGLEDAPTLTVGCEDVEQVIAKWTAYPYTT